MDVFDQVWDRMARRDQCDGRGGAEYQRVLAWWLFSGRPVPIARFIRREANRPADRTYGTVRFTAEGWRLPDGKLYGTPPNSTSE